MPGSVETIGAGVCERERECVWVTLHGAEWTYCKRDMRSHDSESRFYEVKIN